MPEAAEEYGRVEALDDGKWQLRFTRIFPYPVERVWRAVTEPEHLAAWFPTTIEGDRAAGAPLRFTFPRGEAPPFDGEVMAYEPPHVFEFRWGPDVIRLEVRESGPGSVFTLYDTLEERGKAARDAAGWHTCLHALALELVGHAETRRETDTWGQVHPHYVEQFGPEGATIGPPAGAA